MKWALAAAVALSHGIATADPYEDKGWERIGRVNLEKAQVHQETGSKTPIPVAIVEAPSVTKPRYLVTGEVKYSNADGFLEMWNIFGTERYFTRTLSETGPMGKLSGSSDWRPFTLPFYANRGSHPDQLEINVVLTGGGSAELRGLTLYQTDKSPGGLSLDKQWGLLAAAVALVATLIVWINCARRKRAQRELRKMQAADLS